MKTSTVTTSKVLALTILCAVFGAALIASATYKNPVSPYPKNSTEPIDTSGTSQGKAGGLSVQTFLGLSNVQLNQNATFKGAVLTGNIPDIVQIGTDTVATGEMHATSYLNSQTLTHTGVAKTLCGDSTGNIIFCN